MEFVISELQNIQELDIEEEAGVLDVDDRDRRSSLKNLLLRKLSKQVVKWKQRSRCKWLKEGDENTKFFHSLASARNRFNRILLLVDSNQRLEKREDAEEHKTLFFKKLYSKEAWNCPFLDNLAFSQIDTRVATWLERPFSEDELKTAEFDLGSDRAPGPDGFPMAFFQTFWEDVKDFVSEFLDRGFLSKDIGASFIALTPKKMDAEGIKDFRPISLIGSVYKVIAKVLAGRLQRVLPSIISKKQAIFVKGRQILNSVLVAHECLQSSFEASLEEAGFDLQIRLQKGFSQG